MKKMRNTKGRKTGCFLLVIVLIAIVFAACTYNSDIQKKFFYPYPYRDIVEKYARSNDVDPLLVISIMKAESKFDTNAVSAAGALGLMQLMPDSAAWVAEQAGTKLNYPDELLRPEKSIELGSWYIASLLEERKGNLVLALAAYNAGRGVVDNWVKVNKWPDTFHAVDKIPYKETREFVGRVLVNYQNYKKLYRNGK